MANDTVKPRPGALKLAISKVGTTQSDLARKVGCSRTTILAVIAGKEVKSDTLKDIADGLNLPISHLLEDTSGSEIIDGPELMVTLEDAVFGTSADIKARRLTTTDDLRKVLLATRRLEWQLLMNDISDEVGEILKAFEQHVVSFNSWENMLKYRSDESLTRLITIDKSQRDMGTHIQILADKGIHLYGARFSYWTRDEDSHGDRFADEYPGWLDYSSVLHAILALSSQSTGAIRVHASIGHPPPPYATDEEPRIKINGRWLGNREEENDPDIRALNFMLS